MLCKIVCVVNDLFLTAFMLVLQQALRESQGGNPEESEEEEEEEEEDDTDDDNEDDEGIRDEVLLKYKISF